MKESTKERILFEGAKLIHLNGYNNTGLQEILRMAGVPKGSFYFYFKNKEDFGLQLIDYYLGNVLKKWTQFYDQEDVPPIQRLRDFYNWFISVNEKAGFKGGCPIGNLSQELGDVSDVFQVKLNDAFSKLKEMISVYLKEAQERDEISKKMDISETSDLIFSCFQGALIQMKVARNTKSVEIFNRMLFDMILRY
ncbi:TetR/AcrR family transcriptional regulator [bacterium]|nr:TetR/AcrR family transcriptional regulator [bacterium]